MKQSKKQPDKTMKQKYSKRLLSDMVSILKFEGGSVCFKLESVKRVMKKHGITGNPSNFTYAFIFDNSGLVLKKFNSTN